MNIPELLYRLRTADQGSALIRPWFRRSDSGAVAVAQIAPVIPAADTGGRVIILTSAAARCIPGAGQSWLNTELAITDASGNQVYVFKFSFANPALAAALTGGADWEGEKVLPIGSIIRASTNFSAGGVANRVIFDVIGISIPRGTIENP